jgi:hypothetical protein
MKRDFEAQNRCTVEGHFCTVHVTAASSNDGGNDDAWRITITPDQRVEFFGQERDYVSFVVVGGQEMVGIYDALPRAIADSMGGFPPCK